MAYCHCSSSRQCQYVKSLVDDLAHGTQLDARFEKLFQVMAMYLEEGCRPPEDEPVFIIELFYDTVAGW